MQRGISGQPACRVAGNIEFGDDADTAIARIRNNRANLRLCVIKAVRAHQLQPRMQTAFHAEALVVREVPVQDVEFHRGHGVQVAFHRLDRHEVPRDVHH